MLVRIHPDNPPERIIQKVVEVLRKGGLVIYPTDTVYGLGCDINNHRAVERVARLKGIKAEKANFSFICHDMSHLSEYTKPINQSIFKLMKRCLPGPFTFILPASKKVPLIFENKKKTIGIRVPDNKIVCEIVRMLGNPIMTTSIHSDDEVIEYINDPELIYQVWEDKVEIVIDGGYGQIEGSTVIDCTSDEPVIVRQGLGIIEL